MSGSTPTKTSRGAFEIISKFLYGRAGMMLPESKLYLVESRLGPVAQAHGLGGMAELAAILLTKGDKADALASAVIEAMTTNETFFFRDEKPFDHLRTVAIPALHAARPPGQKLRIWSAASSSGQEAYSICMILQDMRDKLAGRPVEIVGTDLSREQVDRAVAGVYSHFEVQRGLPVQMLVKYFERDDKSWKIKSPLRDLVSFRPWNLLDDAAQLGNFDIVFCRNVLIYFDQNTKVAVLDRIAKQMPQDGLLYLGGAETVVGLSTQFSHIPGEVAFRRTPRAAAPSYRPEMIRSTS